MTQVVIKVAPQQFTRRKFDNLGQCLEREPASGKYYARIKLHRGTGPKQFPLTRTRILIPGTTENAARKNLTRLLDQFDQFRIGRADNPFARRANKLTIAELAHDYLEADCPKRDGETRTGKQLAEEKRRVRYLTEYFGKLEWDQVTVEGWNDYRKHRAATRARKASAGDRAIDLEWVCLSCIYRLAIIHKTRTAVDKHPIAHRIVFRKSKQVRHARSCMPKNAEELHRIAAHLLQDPKSQSLAWQMLAQSMIGHRTNELLRLRRDAAEGEPGYIERDQFGVPKILYLVSSRAHKGAYGHIEIHPDLRRLLEILFAWCDEHYPKSPWFFPSPLNEGLRHVNLSSLTKALRRACKTLGIPQRTAHGMRSYYVNVLRSDRDSKGRPKLSDAEIALRVGQKTGGREIVDVYGEILPHKLSWQPKHQADAAWHIFKHGREHQLELSL